MRPLATPFGQGFGYVKNARENDIAPDLLETSAAYLLSERIYLGGSIWQITKLSTQTKKLEKWDKVS